MKPVGSTMLVVSVFFLGGTTGCGKKEAPTPPPVAISPDKPAPSKVEPAASETELVKVDDASTVKVEFDVAIDPRSIITIGGNEYTRGDLDKEITVKPGKHQLTVKQPGLNLPPRAFTVEKSVA